MSLLITAKFRLGVGFRADLMRKAEGNVGIGVPASGEMGRPIYGSSSPVKHFGERILASPLRGKTGVGCNNVGIFAGTLLGK